MRAAVADHLRIEARWRERKAEQYPDDHRNARAATGLYKAAEWVKARAFDDPLLERIIDLHDDENYYILEPRHSPHGGPPTIVPLGPGKLHCDVSGFRFDVPTESIADFLERFVTAMEADKTWDRAWDKVRGRGA